MIVLVLLAFTMVGSAMTVGSIASHRVALPALKFGGEWVGHCTTYSLDSGDMVSPGPDVLIHEQWNEDKQMERHSLLFDPDGCRTASRSVLPLAQSGSELLTLGARMLEPEVLNIRAWALDAVMDTDPQYWRCETILDGWCGDRPVERAVSLECPKERTRIQFAFDPSSGTFDSSSPAKVFHERCWAVSPAADLNARECDDVDPDWLAAAVGFDAFGASSGVEQPAAADGSANVLMLECGVELRGSPGLLELVQHSGKDARNGYKQIRVTRSWVGESSKAGCSVFTAVEVMDDTTGAL